MSIPPPEENRPGDSHALMLLVPVIAFAISCPIFVAVRIWARVRSEGPGMGPDDWMIIASLIIAFASGGAVIAGVQYGYGKHAADLTPFNRIQASMWFFICQATFKWAISTTKVSILLLYMRIFSNVRWLRWACWIFIGIVTAYLIAQTGTSIFQCTPVERAWDKSVPGTCINNTASWFANSIFSTLTDFIILMLPMRLVYQLQIPRPQRIALALVFCIGIFVVITACLRMTTLQLGTTTSDVTYDIGPTMWSIVEQNVAIICACLPMFRGVVVAFFPRLFSRGAHYAQRGDRYATGMYGPPSKIRTIGPFSRDNERYEWHKGDIELNSAQVRRHSSEEHILRSEHDGMGPMSSAPKQSIPAEPPMGQSQTGIHRTVEYSVCYSKENGKQQVEETV